MVVGSVIVEDSVKYNMPSAKTMVTEKHNHLMHELGDDLMHTPVGRLPQHVQQEILWHLQANDFPGAKRVRDKYERQQRIKASTTKLQQRLLHSASSK